MKSKNRFYTVIVLMIIFASVPYMFVHVNKTAIQDVSSVIESEIENTNNYGQIYLRFDGVSKKNAPKILINGKSVCEITESKKTLDVFDMCVVELDTRNLDDVVALYIEGKSGNVITKCVDRVIIGNGSIEKVGTFELEKR